MKSRLPPKEKSLYFLAMVIFLIIYFGVTPSISEQSSGFIYRFLHLMLRKPLDIELSEHIISAWPISTSVEIHLLLTSPGFYSGLFIGYLLIDNSRSLWKGFVPSLLIISPVMVLGFIPNPVMLAFRILFVELLAVCVPQSLIGATIGWLARNLKGHSS